MDVYNELFFYRESHEPNPTQPNPIQSNPIQSNPIQSNPIQSNPSHANPIQSNPIQSKERHNRARINQIYPALDMDWQKCLAEVFEEMPEEWRDGVNKEILSGKGIEWDWERNVFHDRSVPVDFILFVEEKCHDKLRPLAKWCVEALNEIRSLDDALDIIDLLENTFEKIKNLDIDEEESNLLSNRRMLHEAFVFAAGQVIKEKTNLLLPGSSRNLSVDVVKTFINEVFLKHQLLDYGFYVLREQQLAQIPHPLIREYLLLEQKSRKLEVVQSTRYYFAVAAFYDESVNLFSVRRFLNEEQILEHRFYNCAFIGNADLDHQEHAHAFKEQIQHIFSVGETVAQEIIHSIEQMKRNYSDFVRPALFKPMGSFNTSLQNVVVNKVKVHEQELVKAILSPLKGILLKHAVHKDDFDYIFVNIMYLFKEVIMDFSQFQLQPAVRGDLMASQLMMRLIAYVQMLQKRRKNLFTRAAVEEWEESREQAFWPLQRAEEILEQGAIKYKRCKDEIASLKKKMDEKPGFLEGLIDFVLKRGDKRSQKMAEIKKRWLHVQNATYLELLALMKEYRPYISRMEQEENPFMISLRNYAVIAGDNGIDALPAMLVLPESSRKLNPVVCLQTLLPNKWDRSVRD